MNEMDRYEFVKVFWQKRIRPLLLIVGIFIAVTFVINVFRNDGPERFLVLLIVSLTIFFLIVNLLSTLIEKGSNFIYSKLPQSVKNGLRILSKVFDYLAPILFGILIYHLWMKDWIFTSLFFCLILIDRILHIIQKEKMALTSTNCQELYKQD